MGNYISCTPSSSSTGKPPRSRPVTVIFPTGETREFYQPMKAAELMLEAPNFFLANSSSLHTGRRFSALNADDDLHTANVYVMVPMKRLNSIVTAADMGHLFLAASPVAGRGSSVGGNFRRRILPEPASKSDEGDVPELSLDGGEELSPPEFNHRASTCRSKRPVLETIAEEPVC